MPKGTAQRPATAPQARREEDILDDLLQKMAVCNADLRKADHITATRKQDFMESTAYTKSENTFDAMTTYYLGDQRHYANSQLRGDATFFDSTAQRMPPPKQPHAAHSLLQMLPKETRRPRKEDADSMPFELTNVYCELPLRWLPYQCARTQSAPAG
jgi:hypothetical protein